MTVEFMSNLYWMTQTGSSSEFSVNKGLTVMTLVGQWIWIVDTESSCVLLSLINSSSERLLGVNPKEIRSSRQVQLGLDLMAAKASVLAAPILIFSFWQ